MSIPGPKDQDQGQSGSRSQPFPGDSAPHLCGGCNARFTRMEHLKRHITSIHSGQHVKPHTCQFCRKGFSRRDVLLRHHQSCRAATPGSVLATRRIKRACQTCKELKLKCSGGPRCEKCTALGQDCVYIDRQKTTEARANNGSSGTLERNDHTFSEDLFRDMDMDQIDPALHGDHGISFTSQSALPNGSPTGSETRDHLNGEEQLAIRGSTTADFFYRPSSAQDTDNDRRQNSHVNSRKPPPTEPKPASKRGRYVSKACINCQKRKVKCSGEETCLHCRSGLLECIYPARRRRNMTAQKGTRFPEPSVSATSTADDIQAAESVMARLERLEKDLVMFKHHNVGNSESNDTESESSESDEVFDPEADSPSNASTATTLPLSDAFHGASSLYEPISVLNRIVAAGEDRQDSMPEREGTPFNWPHLPRNHNTDVKTLEKNTKADIPGLRRSIDQYFSHLNPHYPSLNENKFRAEFESFVRDTDQPNSVDRCQFVALVNLIHAVVLILDSNSTDNTTVPGWTEFCRAESILSQLFWLGGDGNILTLQCLLVKCHYLLYLEKSDSAHDTMGRMIHLCFLLRLHNQASWTGCSDFEIVMKQRIFWSIFITERILAVNGGIPYLLRDTDFEVDYPRNYDDKSMFPDRPLPELEIPERSFSPYLRASSKWGRFGSEIWDTLFSVKAQVKKSTLDSEFVVTMDARLLHAASLLPTQLQWEHNVHRLVGSSDLPVYIFRQSIILYLQLNQLRLHLRQEAMLSLTYDHKTAEEAVAIAASSVNAIHTYYTSQYHKQISRFSATLYLMGSLLVLVCVIVKNDNHQHTRAHAIEAFKKGLEVHNEMSTNYTMSRHALRRIHRIIRRTQQVIHTFQNTEESQINAFAPELTGFLGSDQSWMMDLDKDMLMPNFHGHSSSIHDGLDVVEGMEGFWRDDDFNNRRMAMAIQSG